LVFHSSTILFSQFVSKLHDILLHLAKDTLLLWVSLTRNNQLNIMGVIGTGREVAWCREQLQLGWA